ncbi:calcium-binding protein [Microvirga aerophila]|uniref:calcium-binding protein n=1 Tax=Microvirga aerophila TaxID=670291 RepID=UPI000DEFD203|nr:calcium-binding protein [Microvirga aerophila]
MAANNVDVLDATDNLIVYNTLQDIGLAEMVFAPNDTVILRDTNEELTTGTVAQVAGLARKNVDFVDVVDNGNVVTFSVAHFNALQVPLSPGDTMVLTDNGINLGTLTPDQIRGLAGKGVTALNATNNALSLTDAQLAALGPVALAAGDVLTRLGTAGADQMVGTAVEQIIDGLAGNDTLRSGSLAHTLKGGAGNDRLFGSTAADKLYGGTGKDTMTGGKGKDAFVFDTKPNKKTNLDKIVDYNVKDDSVYLDNAIFKKLGGKGSEFAPAKINKAFFKIADSAKDRNDYVVYDNKKGVLYYDADGSGGGKAVEIATLKKNLKMSASDLFVI